MSSAETQVASHDDSSSAVGASVRSPLRHIGVEQVGLAARTESRNREIHLPPVSVYRWWARRTESVNGAIIDATSKDHPGRLLIADPFAGGGVLPLAAVLRGHRVYAQDLNPWAAEGLAGMLGLPNSTLIRDATERLRELISHSLREAYATISSAGAEAEISHTMRVASACCGQCGSRMRLFPHALVSLKRRRERGFPEAFLACPAGHLFEGSEDSPQACPRCQRMTDPAANYTARRVVTCQSCGAENRLDALARDGAWRWDVVLVERSVGRQRELGLPSTAEVRQAEAPSWEPNRELAAIPAGQETPVLLRHGFVSWHDLYPRRQRVITERLLSFAGEATDDDRVYHALRLAIVGAAEMAGHLSRWDRFYLKSYESMAGHRFNFSTFVVEPNVWGASASGRGTVRRRLDRVAEIADWTHERVGRTLRVDGPVSSSRRRSAVPAATDVRVVEGSSERLLLPDGVVDLVLTDPPYHDDVEYDELSLPLRAWAELPLDRLEASASVNQALSHNSNGDDYEELLARIFREARRTMRPQGHLIFSYANRSPGAWSAVLGALEAAELRACGFAVVHAENETDVAKRGVRACHFDLIMDLVPEDAADRVEQWRPTELPKGAEGEFLRIVGEMFLRVGELPAEWRSEFEQALAATAFLGSGAPRDGREEVDS